MGGNTGCKRQDEDIEGDDMKTKVTLLARVKEIREGKPFFGFERVETYKKGKPVVPKEPKDAETRVTSYYLRFTEGGKRITKPAGSNFSDAVVALRNKEVERRAHALYIRVRLL